MSKWGLHIHHDILCEPLTGPIDERIEFVRDTKPAHEIPTRIRVMRELTEAEVNGFPAVYQQAGVVYQQAEEAFCKVWGSVAHNQARDVYYKAWVAYEQARVDHATELEAWHRQVCVPDCPWDGKTLFPEIVGG